MPFTLARCEGVALRCSAGKCGRFDIDSAVVDEPHLVVARLPYFAAMLVAGAVLRVVERLGIGGVEITLRRDAANDRKHRHLTTLLPATRAGQEGMAEAEDLLVVVAPACVMRADRADLDHAERR